MSGLTEERFDIMMGFLKKMDRNNETLKQIMNDSKQMVEEKINNHRLLMEGLNKDRNQSKEPVNQKQKIVGRKQKLKNTKM